MAETFKIGVDGNFAGKEFKALGYYNDAEGYFEGVEGDFIRASDKYVPFEGILRKYNPNEVAVQSVNGVKSINLEANAATNLITQSLDINNAYYQKTGATTIFEESDSPETGEKSGKLVEDSSNGSHRLRTDFLSISSGETYTFSCYAKAGERNVLRLFDNYINSGYYFNLEDGTIGSQYGAVSTVPKIEKIGDYYRISFTYTSIGTNALIYMQMAEDNENGSYQGDGVSGMNIWGVDFKQGELSSFVKTEGSTATREADQLINFGNSNIFNSEEGVIEVDIQALVEGGSDRRISLNDGSSSNRVEFVFKSNENDIQVILAAGGVTVFNSSFDLSGVAKTQQDRNVFKLKYKSGDNGIKLGEDELFGNSLAFVFTSPLNTLSYSNSVGSQKMDALIYNTTIHPDTSNY